MNNIIKKTQIIVLLTTMLISLSIPMFANTVSADPLPNWDVTGEYLVDVELDGEFYPEKLILTQVGSSITGGSINTVPPDPNSLFIMDSGSVVGDVINFYGYYSPNDAFRIHFSGNIASNGSISGDWEDLEGGSGRIGAWKTTTGSAQPAIISLTFPLGSSAVPSVEIIEEGNLPRCVPMLPDGIGQYIQVEIIDGSFDGTVMVCIRYDQGTMTEEEEANLRLYMGDCVDFNLDGTINGQDLALILKGIRNHETVSPMNVPFNVDNDEDVDEDDVNIVKEYMTNGLIVNLGLNDIIQARLPWIDITLSVDIEANIICGETDHFSIFRGR